MPLIEAWVKAWLYLGFMIGWSRTARPHFDISSEMEQVFVPADTEVDSTIFRLRATDEDADYPLIFYITAKTTPIVRVENLPCTLYNKVCQANVILVRRLIPGRLHDFTVTVKDSKGDLNNMPATICVTNASTPRDKIFPHIPSLIMIPENAKPGKELDYILARPNPRSGKPVYIELWQPKELFNIRMELTKDKPPWKITRGVITLIGELDFETQSMYTLTIYAMDPYNEEGKDTRNIAGLQLVVVVQDVQDVPPIFTLAPPLTKINNTVQPGDVILRVHAEDGDKGVPRVVTYGLSPENNPFVSFFNISEMNGEIFLARPLQELTQITYVGAPVVLKVVAEEIRRTREEPPAQSTEVEVGFLLGEPGNNPPHFENNNYMAWLDENTEPGKVVMFSDPYSTKVKDEDVGKAGVFALKLANNNGTFEVGPAVGERSVNFIITVRDNTLIDYELHQSLHFEITAQEVGPSTNLSATVPVTIFLRDVNDNLPIFDTESYEVEISENATVGTKVVQVHATDKDSGLYGMILYTRITGPGSEAFTMDPNTGVISVAMGSKLDRELTSQLQLSVEARDEAGKGLRGVVRLIINLLDVNDNVPIFDKPSYEFTLNRELTNFTMPVFLKATDADAKPPNNLVRYEIIQGNYENKFYLNEVTGELVLREPVNKTRYIRQNTHPKDAKEKNSKTVDSNRNIIKNSSEVVKILESTTQGYKINKTVDAKNGDVRNKRAEEAALFTLIARAYDLGVPHLSSQTRIRVLRGAVMGEHIVMFVMPGEHPDPAKTADTLATITGERVIIREIRPYIPQPSDSDGGKKSVIVACVEQKDSRTLVDIEKIREILAANRIGVLSEMPTDVIPSSEVTGNTKIVTDSSVTIQNEQVYKTENKLLMWLLILLGILVLLAIICLIVCCICPGCPFYMEPRKRRIHSSETLIYRADGRPKRHLRRQRTMLEGVITDSTKKQAWSADPMKRNWQFNRRNTKQYGIASLPGDVVREAGVDIEPKRNAQSLRLPDSPIPVHRIREFVRRSDDDRIYIENVEAHARIYDGVDVDSIRRHEIARGSDISRQRQLANHNAKIREQHFFREGNTEVLRLVTRGQDEEQAQAQERDQLQGRDQAHRPVPLVIEPQSRVYRDGKDILLQRFIEDQEMRLHLYGSRHDIEGVSMESHQHPKEMSPTRQEILLIPQRLEPDQKYHYDDLGPDLQRLVIDQGVYGESKRSEDHENARSESHGPKEGGGEALAGDPVSKSAENSTNDRLQPNLQTYTINEVELVKQNALLTRLLLEKETSRGIGETLVDGSYLETQSLPGQVATATQTDRTTSTQTDRQVRSRSDNDESEDDDRLRKKTKVKKKSEIKPKLMKTIWIKTTIPEEVHQKDGDHSRAFRKKVADSREMKRASVSPEVLQEISDSLDEHENGSSLKEDDEDDLLTIYQRITGKDNIKIYESKTDSTSPETEKERFAKGRVRKVKEKTGLVVSAARKKGEPSFRILEKEISSLQKKIRTFGQRKSKKVDEVEEESEPLVCDSKTVKKKLTTIRDEKKEELKRNLQFKHDRELKSESLAKEIESHREKKQEEARLRTKPLKHQHAVQAVSLEIVDQEDVPEKGKEYVLKRSDEQASAKISSGSFKLKRQPRLQVSRGAVKSIISRTKEVTKRKVKELKKETDSSRDKQSSEEKKNIGHRVVGKQVTEDSKKSLKPGSDVSKRAYAIVSTKVETSPSKIVFKEKEKQQKTAEGYKTKAQLAKDNNEVDEKIVDQHTIPSVRTTEFVAQEHLGAIGIAKMSIDQKYDKTDSRKTPIFEHKSATKEKRSKNFLDEKSGSKDVKREKFKQKSATADGRRILDSESVTKESVLEQKSFVKARSSKTALDEQTLTTDERDEHSLEQQSLITGEKSLSSLKQQSVITYNKGRSLKEQTLSTKLTKSSLDPQSTMTDKGQKSSLEQKSTRNKDIKPSLEHQALATNDDEKSSLDQQSSEVDKCSKPSLAQQTSASERSKTPLNNEDLETEKSSPKIKKLMLETDDMRFIDDSQESTDTSEDTHSKSKCITSVTQDNKADANLQSQSLDLNTEKESKNSGSLSGKVKGKDEELEKCEEGMSEDMDWKRKTEKKDEVVSPQSSSNSVQSKSSEEVLRRKQEFPYRHLPESDTSTDSVFDHEHTEKKEIGQSKTVEEPVPDEEIGLKKEQKDEAHVKIEKEYEKEGGGQKERKSDEQKENKEIIDNKVMINLKTDVSKKLGAAKVPKLRKTSEKSDQNLQPTSFTPSSGPEDFTSQKRNIDPTVSDAGTQKITSPKKRDETAESADISESSDKAITADTTNHTIPKIVGRSPLSKPSTPKLKSESLEPDFTTKLKQTTISDSVCSKDQQVTKDLTITKDLAIQKPSTPIRMNSRDADYDRKIAKVLAEEQQRLHRLELLYKHFNESDDDSDSSADSDMSSKTMFTTKPYRTPQHSPTRELGDDELKMKDVKDVEQTLASDDLKNEKKASEESPRILQKGTGEVASPGLHLIMRQTAVDVDQDKVDVKEHKNDHKPVIVDSLKKQNLKDPSIPQKSSVRIETHLRSSKSLDSKSSPHKATKKAHLSDDEARKGSKLVMDKSLTVVDVERGHPDAKIQPGFSKKEDSRAIGKSRKPLVLKEITKSHFTEDDPRKQSKRGDKSPMGLGTEKPKDTEQLGEKDSESRNMISRRDGRKFSLEKSASTTDVEKQLKKKTHPRKMDRSLSPRKEVKNHLSDDEISRRDKSPINVKEKEQLDHDKKQSHKLPRKEVRKPIDEKVQDVESDHKADHNRQLHLTKTKIDKDLKLDSEKEEVIKAQSRYMSWYKQKREEMEKKRFEKKLAEEEEQRPRWMKRSRATKPRKPSDADGTQKTKLKVKPSVNVESEQLKAIVRQGRKMRKAEGHKEDLTVQIFAPKKPPPVHESSMQPTPKHPLIQHSEYKYEKMPTPFYLHPPPVPHPSPQLSPEHFSDKEARKPDDDLDSGIAVSLQGGTRLRHQQLLEKKSVFDIAYNEAAPSHLRSDSSTPPS